MHQYAKFYISSMTEIKGYFTIDSIPKKSYKGETHENDDTPERWHSNFGTAR